ncbi:hypothetical protein QML58_18355, partial [Providencia rettgeri]|nr:hypothetical protein [Providencia rettgeri]
MELPPAFPDELLLGRLMRHIILTGEPACSFSSRVFGSSRLSLHPFLTAGISRIAEMSGENADNLLVRQTLAPLFFFYLPKHANCSGLINLATWTEVICSPQNNTGALMKKRNFSAEFRRESAQLV